jgi:menaquinol-cytochrome c reductase cytochrome b subunit
MVIVVVVHLARVFFAGAYKRPRQFNWVLGVGLLLFVVSFGFTGYLLPWDQKAYWATNVGLNIAATVPFVGPGLATFLRGGPDLGALTLIRFYALHVFILPIVLGIGLLLHFAMIRKQGIARPL